MGNHDSKHDDVDISALGEFALVTKNQEYYADEEAWHPGSPELNDEEADEEPETVAAELSDVDPLESVYTAHQAQQTPQQRHPGVPFTIFHNKVAGMLAHGCACPANQPAEGANSPYDTYFFGLRKVGEILGANVWCPWSPAHPTVAVMQAGGPQALLTKKKLEAEHKALYTTSNNSQGVLYNGDSLLQLLNFGKRDGHQRLFTYVITNQGMFFSETGSADKHKYKNMLSKHLVLSRVSPEVRYAGEFVIHQDMTLVLDNRSGTYTPNPRWRLRVVKLLKSNFPGLKVRSVPHEKVRKYKTQLIDFPELMKQEEEGVRKLRKHHGRGGHGRGKH
eukprot:TRINITY_DN54775_c0_g1_i1.p1 TRINITY_DN54775_c0_g1~~TRINITY_DN54775_c0_g1_i1.p1  ORF type:complete len:334 (+),score=27.48 TRINITY_DN54775_c0_g1_i1:88-1089(+)